ncbi:MAG: two-component system response regulator [Parvibaculum sp.]|nr:two-component system response regulator [Parvibaculum sp.]|tara:strand:+ start:654 stop:1199 length:546 start_codon:yes stop_codon:yes gene_type:complete
MASPSYDLSVLTAMFVDDSPYMRKPIHDLLTLMGIGKVITAADGESALKMYKEQSPDLLITDANMAPMDGFEFVRRIRMDADNPNPFVPIIMLSGHVEMANIERARDQGVTEYLAKPVSAQSLMTRVISVIERPRQFVKVGPYFGPDRRRHTDDVYFGEDKRGDEQGHKVQDSDDAETWAI